MKKNTARPTDLLTKKGVIIPDPTSVFIDSSVAPEKIAPGTVIHPFSRISGPKTSIGPGCVLGAEGLVTVDNCQLGAEVKLAGGYFCGATFLDNSSMGSCAHVRPGTLVEEFAGGAHAVGLKQTILFPYVVLGSLINFCDCLMAGGNGRKNHSEVGSSYIHFNFTPHQDKATPSLIGDVPCGVHLDQPPIFLGGQGGLVGPARIAFGAIIPAGVIRRKDVLSAGVMSNPEPLRTHSANSKGVGQGLWPSRLKGNGSPGGFAPPTERGKTASFIPGAYRSIDRIISNNLIYIGNIYALRAWYWHVRAQFMTKEKFQSACLAGALERLDSIIQERINRLDELAGKMPLSIELNKKSGNGEAPYLQQQKAFAEDWQRMQEDILQLATFEGNASEKDKFLAAIAGVETGTYLEAVAALSSKGKANAVAWLQSIVDRAAGIWKTDKYFS